jgi:hypothetical protein
MIFVDDFSIVIATSLASEKVCTDNGMLHVIKAIV